jgi:biopolymer transport protein ExbD
MKVRKSSTDAKVEQNMTAMIDVVFQLLTFFVMSFKVAADEGDFSIKMPLSAASKSASIDEPETPPLKLRMIAHVDGNLSSMRLNSTPLPADGWNALRQRVIDLVGKEAPGSGAGGAEVELDCDPQLKYNYVIEAITAVSGQPTSDGGFVKLVEKVKFAAPRGGGS